MKRPAGATPVTADSADQVFLTRMTDHHEGLVLLTDRTLERPDPMRVTPDARALHDKQDAEQEKMLGMLDQQFKVSHRPVAMPKHKAMSDSLEQLNGEAYNRKFYEDVIVHHREGIATIDSVLPRLRTAEVKTMAQRMKAEQQKDIREFTGKMKSGS